MTDNEQEEREDQQFAAVMRQFFPGVPVTDVARPAEPKSDAPRYADLHAGQRGSPVADDSVAVDAHLAHFFPVAQPPRR
jgi:hypothetical protein